MFASIAFVSIGGAQFELHVFSIICRGWFVRFLKRGMRYDAKVFGVNLNQAFARLKTCRLDQKSKFWNQAFQK
ncbi:hypothetical protein [Burkholderia stagnalis]